MYGPQSLVDAEAEIRDVMGFENQLFSATLARETDKVEDILSSWADRISHEAIEVAQGHGIELMVLLCQRALKAGAKEEDLVRVKKDFFSAISGSRETPVILDVLRDSVKKLAVACETRPSAKKRDLVQEAVSFVEDHCEARLSLKNLAEQFYMSRSSASGLFRHGAGVGFKACQIRSRIHRAKGMLRESDLPVQEVARSLGFRDSSHFCRTFRRLEGCTPTEFRQESMVSVVAHQERQNLKGVTNG